jgi:hypothetical protein
MTEIVHGTPAGYASGCRASGECENQGSATLMTCAEAQVRYRGDYAYHKAVDSGVATAEKLIYDKPTRSRATPEPKPKGQRFAGSLDVRHGTHSGYNRGCQRPENCPNLARGLPTCYQVHTDYNREWALQARRARGVKPKGQSDIPHGKMAGYKRGCRLGDQCPGKLAGGLSCKEAIAIYNKHLRHEAERKKGLR